MKPDPLSPGHKPPELAVATTSNEGGQSRAGVGARITERYPGGGWPVCAMDATVPTMPGRLGSGGNPTVWAAGNRAKGDLSLIRAISLAASPLT